MSEDDNLAEELLLSLQERRQIPLFTTRSGGMSIDRAYRVSGRIEAIRADRGERPIGRKIGFTNRTIWDEYNVAAPIFAPMYDSTVRSLGAPFAVGGLMEPRIEPEIAFRLANQPEPGMTTAELMACVSGICAGFELVQSVYADWKFAAADTVAAFGLHGAFLHGPMVELPPSDREDWIGALASFSTKLHRNGQLADEGDASNVLGGGPLVALGHLVDLIARMPQATPLAAGEIVSTGTLTRALPIAPEETWRAVFDGLPLDAIEIELI